MQWSSNDVLYKRSVRCAHPLSVFRGERNERLENDGTTVVAITGPAMDTWLVLHVHTTLLRPFSAAPCFVLWIAPTVGLEPTTTRLRALRSAD